MNPFQLVKSEVHPLTPALAFTMKELPGSPTERELNEARLKHLRMKADQGRLVTFQWATATMPDGRKYRMNGMHSSTMLCDLDGAFPTGLFVHLDEYTVDSEDGLALLFRQFDDRKSGRSAADVANAYQGLEAGLKDTAKPIAKLGIEGYAWFRRYIAGVPQPFGDDQYSLFHDASLHPYLRWLNEVISIKTPELKRPGVVAAMWGTFEKNPEEARNFWLQVSRGGQEYEDNAPSTVLDNWLKSIKEEKIQTQAGEFFRGCIYAWNAYREEKTIKDIKFDITKTMRPIAD